MQAPAFIPASRRAHDQVSHLHQIPQLQPVAGDVKVCVQLLNLPLPQRDPACGTPSVLMPMMRVREVCVVMRQGFVAVRVAVAFSARRVVGLGVAVLMMLVVAVRVVVFDRLVGVKVLVALGQVQPDSDAHHETGNHQRDAQRLVKQRHGHERAEKWCH